MIRRHGLLSSRRQTDKLWKREQVAAVCFRILSTGVEFLLVRTRRGRWTFPKGGVQEGLTHAQSAAIEAYEEAGVHGRIEEVAFLRYQRDAGGEDPVAAHLCEVLSLQSPQETYRNPTWFTPEKAKRRLAQGRPDQTAAELSRVVDRAITRIRRFPARAMLANDPLLKIRFEASEIGGFRFLENAAWHKMSSRTVIEPAPTNVRQIRGKILQLRPIQIDGE